MFGFALGFIMACRGLLIIASSPRYLAGAVLLSLGILVCVIAIEKEASE